MCHQPTTQQHQQTAAPGYAVFENPTGPGWVPVRVIERFGQPWTVETIRAISPEGTIFTAVLPTRAEAITVTWAEHARDHR